MKFKENDILLTDINVILLIIGVFGTDYIVRYNDHFYCIAKDTVEKHCVKIGVL